MLSLTVFLPVEAGGRLPEGFPEAALPLTSIQQRPALDAGKEEACELCGGLGRLEFGDLCLRCQGTGNLRAIRLIRVNCEEDDARFEHLLSAKRWAELHQLRTKLLIKLMETGNKTKAASTASIISGIRGERLEAQRLEVRRNGRPTKATFWLVRALQIDYAITGDGNGGLVRLIDLDPLTTKPRQTDVWEFEDPKSPIPMSEIRVAFPKEAAEAAVAKATATFPTLPWVKEPR